ncbi:MAG TPA: LamG-like jellyroll fold domain-containing protein, partial [Sedimentisphaerales bacterium]|nr:LamG-like jellyroll fold domain-containing protein [Sedimentisphaerales bacterium]
MFTKLTYFSCIALVVVLSVGAARADLIVAENLLVDLRADDLTEGAPVTIWPNRGSTTGDFVANENGDPIVVEIVNGAKAVTLNGADWFEGPVSPNGIEGAGTRSIEVWAYNPSIPQEETMVAWAHRGGPGATNMSFNYGNDPLWGAVGHWDGAVYDMGWWGDHSPAPAANTWWYLVYTYDGVAARVYVNGVEESVRSSMTLNTHPDMPIKIGTQNENTAGAPSNHYFSGSLALVRIHDGALSPADIVNNFQFSPVTRASNPIPADGVNVGPQYGAPPNVYLILDYTPGASAEGYWSNAYFSDVEQDVIDRDPMFSLGTVPPWPAYSETAFVVGYDDPGIPEYARAPLIPGTTYYWCVDTWHGTGYWMGAIWSFTVMPKEAWGPEPADGEELVSQNPTCTWRLGDQVLTGYALSYNVYSGTDEAAIAAVATGSTAAPLYKGNVPTETIVLANLNVETEYFWRVDTKLKKNGPPFNSIYTKGDVWSFTTTPPGMGSILREWWQFPTEDWNGDLNLLKNDPRYPDSPDDSELVSLFEGPTNWDPSPGDGVANSYGSRLHGWLYVLESGDYTFWIASDDAGELWLSTDSNPANASLIAYVTGWVNSRDFDDAASGGVGGPGMQSAPVHLEGGQMYYISGLMKEGGGGDNISAAWRGPDTGGVREVIPGNHLMPYVPVTAYSPDPADGSLDAPLNTTLNWSAGIDQSTGAPYTTQHVYVGSDPAAVADATTASPEYKGAPTGPNEYGPLSLGYYQRVYWRIDGVSGETGAVQYPGPVWTFKAIYDPAAPADPNLRLWLKFDSNALDSSGYGRDGTEMNGPTYLAGYDEQAISFDGAADYVDLPIGADIASLTSSTFAAWVNFSNLGGAWQRIFDFGSGTATYLFLCPRIGTDGQMRFAIKPPDAGEQIVDTTTYLSTGWHHLAVTIDAASATAAVYLDGDVVGINTAVTLTPSDVGYSTQNWIGRSQYVADGYLNAALDDFRIYDLAKDAMGIAEIMRIDLSWAWNPYPENNAQDVARDVVLSWSPGDGAMAHTIYLGADDPVNMVQVAGPQGPNSYNPPGDLNLGTTYYWAVVESPGLEMGRTWKFTTSNYLV